MPFFMASVIARLCGFEFGMFVILQKNWGIHSVCGLVRKFNVQMVTRMTQEKKNLMTQ
jgi:hypothetical protein